MDGIAAEFSGKDKGDGEAKSTCHFWHFLIIMGKSVLSKVVGCWQKSPPTWLVSASYSAWHFFAVVIF